MVNDEDIRKGYILNAVANYYGKNPDDFQKYFNDRNLEKFLDDLNILVMVAHYSKHELNFIIKVNKK